LHCAHQILTGAEKHHPHMAKVDLLAASLLLVWAHQARIMEKAILLFLEEQPAIIPVRLIRPGQDHTKL
jgi:hypothetical protein